MPSLHLFFNNIRAALVAADKAVSNGSGSQGFRQARDIIRVASEQVSNFEKRVLERKETVQELERALVDLSADNMASALDGANEVLQMVFQALNGVGSTFASEDTPLQGIQQARDKLRDVMEKVLRVEVLVLEQKESLLRLERTLTDAAAKASYRPSRRFNTYNHNHTADYTLSKTATINPALNQYRLTFKMQEMDSADSLAEMQKRALKDLMYSLLKQALHHAQTRDHMDMLEFQNEVEKLKTVLQDGLQSLAVIEDVLISGRDNTPESA
ncbi:uncharacterized protein BP01DRAFT_380955 [Aspergillus saccharolyticus JOP 1030-1]|uniref:Uncharacterized protein n=1 Tax=Aspergillus saccharolyticus JOP 1030-1 TaxID=1450539 RepID=A0A318ZT25_9EURO|nr:hypothetical protein BP01DRAFT_380955 [Aspergillus saccharolyticus JOP 1030-1]PYH47110.1 hypothetical protein BP01DRAFT_380955 [Aspergillus saccharolyticus JOP 1030-1]